MKKNGIKPLGNKVLVQRCAPPQSKGGIFLPDSAQEKPKQATVLAVGPGKINDEGKLEPMALKEGDVVLFGGYAGREAPGEEDILILAEDDVLAVVE